MNDAHPAETESPAAVRSTDNSNSGSSPTSFNELNDVLWDLTDRVSAILGDALVGVYLQGSFAIGDADLYSDCDFLVPVRQAPTAEQEVALRALHDEIPTRPGHWAKHLEGSYPDQDTLRGLDGLGCPWLYVDHGSREMEWSTHCNTEVVRWTLREHGVTLTGPDPVSLVEPVSPAVLRARMRDYALYDLPDYYGEHGFDCAWAQRLAFATLCRVLITHETGIVTSKKTALLWAEANLPAPWSGMARQVLDDRPLGIDPNEPPRPGTIERTMAFITYVRDRVTSQDREGRP
ncbi:aminoglycoside adenylyltransferase domain-containing protein [Streptomyces sp. NPDC004752]